MPYPIDDLPPTPAEKRVEELEAAIREVVTQDLDDICWRDVYTKLARLVGLDFDPDLLPQETFLENCRRFITSLRKAQPYSPMSAGDVRQEIRELREMVLEIIRVVEARADAARRALERWRAEKPGRDLEVPATADLISFLLDKVADLEAGAEAAELDNKNLGANLCARKLLEVARTGEHRGTFSSSDMEECAQFILTMRSHLDKAEQWCRELFAEQRPQEKGYRYAVDEDADLMTVEEFKGAVAAMCYADDDGFGHPVRGGLYDPDIYVMPSRVNDIPEDATHVVWFNK